MRAEIELWHADVNFEEIEKFVPLSTKNLSKPTNRQAG